MFGDRGLARLERCRSRLASVLALVVAAGIVRLADPSLQGFNAAASMRALGSPVGVAALFSCLFGVGPRRLRHSLGRVRPVLLAADPAAGDAGDCTCRRICASRRALCHAPTTGFRVAAPVVAAFAGGHSRGRGLHVEFIRLRFCDDGAPENSWRSWASRRMSSMLATNGSAAHAPSLADSVKPRIRADVLREATSAGYLACGVVSSEPWADPGYELVGTESYSLNLDRRVRPNTLYLYRATSTDCASG